MFRQSCFSSGGITSSLPRSEALITERGKIPAIELVLELHNCSTSFIACKSQQKVELVNGLCDMSLQTALSPEMRPQFAAHRAGSPLGEGGGVYSSSHIFISLSK